MVVNVDMIVQCSWYGMGEWSHTTSSSKWPELS